MKGQSMNKYMEPPFPCIHCEQPTAPGSGKFVNRVPGDTDHYLPDGTYENRDGYACSDCLRLNCDRRDKLIDFDEDISVEQVYGERTRLHEFHDGSFRVCEECLTAKEKNLFKKEMEH